MFEINLGVCQNNLPYCLRALCVAVQLTSFSYMHNNFSDQFYCDIARLNFTTDNWLANLDFTVSNT